MEKKYDKFYIAFYKFTDTKIWHRSQVVKDRAKLERVLSNEAYLDKASLTIKEIELPI